MIVLNTNEKNNFAELLTSVAELYGKKLSAKLIKIYWQALQQYSFTEISKALNMHVLNPDCGQFMPKPADIVRCLDGGTQTQALQAWGKVIKAIKTIGCYDSVIFDDKLIHVVIEDMGGWIDICKVKEAEMPFRMQEFCKRYIAGLNHPPMDYPVKLNGYFENHNQAHGYICKPAVLITEKHKTIANITRNNLPVLLEGR